MNEQAKEDALLVLQQLVESLVKHHGITRAEARAIIRECLVVL